MSTVSFVCNNCHAGVCHQNHSGNAYVCDECKSTYPLIDGVTDFVPDWDPPLSIVESAMEFKPVVAAYESSLWRRNPLFERLAHASFEEESDAIIEAAELSGDEVVLDLVCGAGNYSRRLAMEVPGGTVIAMDHSHAILEFAAMKAKQYEIENVRFIRGNALEIPIPADSVDVVNCCGALHQFHDVDEVLLEIQRVLKPGGRFTTPVFRHQKGFYAQWLETISRTIIGVGSFSIKGMTQHLHQVGFNHNKAVHDQGCWLIMQSVKL